MRGYLTEMLTTLTSLMAPVSRLVTRFPSRMRVATILRRARAELGTRLRVLWPRSRRVRFRPEIQRLLENSCGVKKSETIYFKTSQAAIENYSACIVQELNSILWHHQSWACRARGKGVIQLCVIRKMVGIRNSVH